MTGNFLLRFNPLFVASIVVQYMASLSLYLLKDALGTSLEEICKIVPGGSLIFFPSYKLMEKLCNRWRETGQWSRLNAQKSLFIGNTFGSLLFLSMLSVVEIIQQL